MEWINQLFEPADPKTFGMQILDGDKIVYYPSTKAVEDAIEKSMA